MPTLAMSAAYSRAARTRERRVLASGAVSLFAGLLAGGRDERAGPPPGLDQAGRLQRPVRPADGVHGEAQVGREPADRRQSRADGERPVLDLPGELGPELLVRRHRRRRVDDDHQVVRARRAAVPTPVVRAWIR
jgi:hypothetical protein